MLAQADAARLPLADRSVDLVVGSPPYCDARTYGIGAQRGCVEWVEWMLGVTAEALRVSKGPVIWIAAGVTRDRTYWPACEGLMWEWFKRGGSAYRPCYWHRVGIPGSGGDQWYRPDIEYAMCFKRPGPLPYADCLANGTAPKWAPGGDLSHRLADGSRVGKVEIGNGRRNYSGDKRRPERAAHREGYIPPDLANPGCLLHTGVGGNQMGHPLAHENEAPFPTAVPAFFIRSHCPPGGLVLDPFSGSGSTGQAAIEEGRRYLGFDLRPSQARLARRRLRSAQPPLPFATA